MNFEQALEQYRARFGENFPIMSMRGTTEEEIIRLIKHSLETEVPYELPPDDSNYPILY